MAIDVKLDEIPWQGWNEASAHAGQRLKMIFSRDGNGSSSLAMGMAELAHGEVLALHRHEPAEIYFILEGTGICEVETIRHGLEAGKALFIAGGEPHRTINTGEGSLRFLFAFPVDDLNDVVYEFLDEAQPGGLPMGRSHPSKKTQG